MSDPKIGGPGGPPQDPKKNEGSRGSQKPSSGGWITKWLTFPKTRNFLSSIVRALFVSRKSKTSESKSNTITSDEILGQYENEGDKINVQTAINKYPSLVNTYKKITSEEGNIDAFEVAVAVEDTKPEDNKILNDHIKFLRNLMDTTKSTVQTTLSPETSNEVVIEMQPIGNFEESVIPQTTPSSHTLNTTQERQIQTFTDILQINNKGKEFLSLLPANIQINFISVCTRKFQPQDIVDFLDLVATTPEAKNIQGQQDFMQSFFAHGYQDAIAGLSKIANWQSDQIRNCIPVPNGQTETIQNLQNEINQFESLCSMYPEPSIVPTEKKMALEKLFKKFDLIEYTSLTEATTILNLIERLRPGNSPSETIDLPSATTILGANPPIKRDFINFMHGLGQDQDQGLTVLRLSELKQRLTNYTQSQELTLENYNTLIQAITDSSAIKQEYTSILGSLDLDKASKISNRFEKLNKKISDIQATRELKPKLSKYAQLEDSASKLAKEINQSPNLNDYQKDLLQHHLSIQLHNVANLITQTVLPKEDTTLISKLKSADKVNVETILEKHPKTMLLFLGAINSGTASDITRFKKLVANKKEYNLTAAEQASLNQEIGLQQP